MIEEEQAVLTQKKSDWQNVQSSLGEELKNHSDVLLQKFPLDLEESRSRLKAIHSQYSVQGTFLPALENYVLSRKHFIDKGTILGMDKTALSPDGKSAHEMTLARFGNVFAYGKSVDGHMYFIRQTGSLGAGRFQIEAIENKSLKADLDKVFPNWVVERRPSGQVPMDILQKPSVVTAKCTCAIEAAATGWSSKLWKSSFSRAPSSSSIRVRATWLSKGGS
jgi:hypothetical protein